MIELGTQTSRVPCSRDSPGTTHAHDAAERVATSRRSHFVRTLAVVALLLTRPGLAHCAWTVDADGMCVRRWETSDLARGPLAIANAPLRPVRTMAGGAEYAWTNSDWWPWYTVPFGAVAIGISGAAGLLESAWWILTGLGDTLTGGYFELTPEPALDFSLQPVLSTVIEGPLPAPSEDRCGRPLADTK
jgi:hypothetical protein